MITKISITKGTKPSFDGARITIGEYQNGEEQAKGFPITVLLTRNGKPVKKEVFYTAFVEKDECAYPASSNEHQFDDASDDSTVIGLLDSGGAIRQYSVRYMPNVYPNLILSEGLGQSGEYKLCIVLPTGEVVKSDPMIWIAEEVYLV